MSSSRRGAFQQPKAGQAGSAFQQRMALVIHFSLAPGRSRSAAFASFRFSPDQGKGPGPRRRRSAAAASRGPISAWLRRHRTCAGEMVASSAKRSDAGLLTFRPNRRIYGAAPRQMPAVSLEPSCSAEVPKAVLVQFDRVIEPRLRPAPAACNQLPEPAMEQAAVLGWISNRVALQSPQVGCREFIGGIAIEHAAAIVQSIASPRICLSVPVGRPVDGWVSFRSGRLRRARRPSAPRAPR